MTDAARLSAIRSQLAAIEPGRWSLAADGDGFFVEAAGPMGELTEIARLHPGASDAERDFVAGAPEAVRFLLGLVDRAARKIRETANGADRRPPDDSGAPAQAVRFRTGRDKRLDPEAAGGGARRERDYAAECAMKCAEPVFRVYLEERHGLDRPLTAERVAQKVRSVLGVTSRAELNDGAQAAARWQDLRRDFEAWRRAGR